MNVMKWINRHKTKITGAVLVAAGAAQANATVLQAAISPKAYAWFTVCIGVLVAVLGFINGSRREPPAL